MRERKKDNSLRGYSSYGSEKGRSKRIRGRILFGFGMIACLFVLLWVSLNFFFKLPKLPDQTMQMPGASHADNSVASDWDIEGPNIAGSGRKEGKYTFLIAGLDVASGATDTMLLLTYDINEKTLLGLNLPRDTMMNVSYSSKRLNTIYAIHKGKDKETQAEKGMAALKQQVSKLTGIMPDYYVLLEWEAIGELVDAIGGVEFEVPFDMDYDDPYQDLHIHQKAGRRLLNGNDAMQVIRHRKNNDGSHSEGDVGRLSIQQDFLKAVVKKCLQPAIFLKIPALAEIFADNVKTDLSVGNILAFAKTAYGMDPSAGVSFQTAPLSENAWYRGAAMVTLDGQGILDIVNAGMNPYLRDITLSDLELIYKKADGSYGVTNGVLEDPAVGKANVPKEEVTEEPEVQNPEPEVAVQPERPERPTEPVQSDAAEEPVQPADPGVTQEPDVFADPGVTQEPGESADPGVIQESDVTADPGVAQESEESADPGVAQEPEESADPGVAQEPEESVDPGIVQEPEESVDPGVAQEPENSESYVPAAAIGSSVIR